MQFAVLSDIHANYEALKTALDIIKKHEIDEIYSLGDLVGYGAQPQEVINLVRSEKIPGVMGNHDEALVYKTLSIYMSPEAKLVISRHARMVTNQAVRYLQSLPMSDVHHDMHLVHGVPAADNWQYIMFLQEDDIRRLFEAFNTRIAFCGHTHLFRYYELRNNGELTIHQPLPDTLTLRDDARYIINNGSVGKPRPPEYNTGFVIYDREAGQIHKKLLK